MTLMVWWNRWGSTGPRMRDVQDNIWAADDDPTDQISRVYAGTAGWPQDPREPDCHICGEHPESERCPYMDRAGALIDVAGGGWSADGVHRDYCRSLDPLCRGECGG